MADRYGAAKLTTIIRDFDRHRTAIRAHDIEAAEGTWLNCERWVDAVQGLSVTRHKVVAGWRSVLADVVADLESEIRARHTGNHPVTLRNLARDMVGVDAAKAVLAEMDAVLADGPQG